MIGSDVEQARGPSFSTAQVLFFGKVGDILGPRCHIALPPEGLSVAELRRRLEEVVEGAAEALCERGVRVAVDLELVGEDARVRPGQEVAFLSMFSGG
jgi:molybdopterin synthase sulfur carrier subunit